jgi:signal transduction histidine kinase
LPNNAHYPTLQQTLKNFALLHRIVQRIVRDHGGALAIHSQAGYGTTVTITLPLAGAA